MNVCGTKMFNVVQKLKRVKRALKELDKIGFNDVQVADVQALQVIKEDQEAMHQHHEQTEYVDLELNVINNYKEKHQIMWSI